MHDDDPAEADVLERGRDRATVLERVHGWVGARRASAFVHRHPMRAGAAGALLAVAAGLAFYVQTRPPPIDPVVQLSVSGTLGDPDASRQSILPAPNEGPMVLTGHYVVRTDVPGDSLQVQGVVGPGLTPQDPQRGGVVATPGHAGFLGAADVLDCSQPGWSTAVNDDYRVRVLRTDRFDRVTQYDAPLGPSAADWRRSVQSGCLRILLAEQSLTSGSVDASRGRPEVRLSFSVQNPYDFPVWLQVAGLDVGEPAPAQKVEPGSEATLKFRTVIAGCEGDSTVLYESDDATTAFVPVLASVEPLALSPQDRFDAPVAGLPVAPDLAGEIARQVATVCAGATPMTARVTGVRRHHGSEFLEWTVEVALDLHADSVEFGFGSLAPSSDIADLGWDDATLRLPGRAAVHGGVARARMTWTLSGCPDASETSPPGFYAVAIVGDRRYPTWLQLDDRHMLAGIRAACDGEPSVSVARDHGWSHPAITD